MCKLEQRTNSYEKGESDTAYTFEFELSDSCVTFPLDK